MAKRLNDDGKQYAGTESDLRVTMDTPGGAIGWMYLKDILKKAVAQIKLPAIVQTVGESTAAVMSQKAVTDELGKRATKADLTGLATKKDLTGLATKEEVPSKPVVMDGVGEMPLIPGRLGLRVNEDGSVWLFAGGRASSFVSHYIRRCAVGDTVTTAAKRVTPWTTELELSPAAGFSDGYTMEAVVTSLLSDTTLYVHRVTVAAQWAGKSYVKVTAEELA